MEGLEPLASRLKGLFETDGCDDGVIRGLLGGLVDDADGVDLFGMLMIGWADGREGNDRGALMRD